MRICLILGVPVRKLPYDLFLVVPMVRVGHTIILFEVSFPSSGHIHAH